MGLEGVAGVVVVVAGFEDEVEAVVECWLDVVAAEGAAFRCLAIMCVCMC